MLVSELGEFGIIAHINAQIKRENLPLAPIWDNVIIAIGDDTAVIRNTKEWELATTDCLVQNVHFNLETITWEELGWKAIAVNLSDIGAMGGIPRYALISLTIPPATTVANITELYNGMITIANEFGVAIIGGNIAAASYLAIHVTLLGTSLNKKVLTRAAAKPGDLIGLTGYTGISAAGLAMLNGKLSFEPATIQMLRQAHLKPIPRIREGQLLNSLGITTAIDISDGLIADLTHICETSKVSAVIKEAALPVHPVLKEEFTKSCMNLILSGGEDYELLFTATSARMTRALQMLQGKITVIGKITDQQANPVTIVTPDGKSKRLIHPGWDHFKPK
ncbi:MAG TPA: thiamine-phosphate kinase [Dehalococcoidia bacterium]|nr:thiamine-phosphate kinase [Dehalococcoidia bacterium]